MAIDQSTIEEKIQRVRADIARELSGSNPFDSGFLNAISIALGGMSDEISTEISNLFKSLFIKTSSGDILRQWGSIYQVLQLLALPSSGDIIVQGTLDTIVPAATQWVSNSGINYTSSQDKTIKVITAALTSVTRVGQTATAIVGAPHDYTSGQSVTITGFNEPEYNGTFEITALNTTTFTYTVVGTPVTPATGIGSSSALMAVIDVTSIETGINTQAFLGETLEITSPIGGVNNTAFVSVGQITGGIDDESDADFLQRVLIAAANTPSAFSVKDVERATRELPQTTRVLVKSATPAPGQVTVLFMTDNDPGQLPTPAQIQTVKENIIAIADVTMDNPSVNLFVNNPQIVKVPIIFNFIGLDPNTTTMKQAVTDNLTSFLQDTIQIEQDVLQAEYEAAIFNTVDPVSGEGIISFTIDSPIGTVPVGSGQVATIGAVTFDV